MSRHDGAGGAAPSTWRRYRPAALPALIGALGTVIAGVWVLLFPAAESSPSLQTPATPSTSLSAGTSTSAQAVPGSSSAAP